MAYSTGSLEQDPVFKVIQEMEKFRLMIHRDVCIFSLYCDKITDLNDAIEHNLTLVGSGFPQVLDENETNKLVDDIRILEEKNSQCSKRLDEYRELGLGEYIDKEMDAMELELVIRRSLDDLDFHLANSTYADWEILLDLLARNLILLEVRREIFPPFDMLENSDLEVSDLTEENRLLELNDLPGEYRVLSGLMQFMSNNVLNTVSKSPSHVCDKYSFYCQYLDDELRNVANWIVASSHARNITVWHAVLSWLMTDNVESCADIVVSMAHGLLGLRRMISIKMYRECMSKGLLHLAEEWMQASLNEPIPTQEQLNSLLTRTQEGLLNCQPELRQKARVKLNGEKSGVSSSYRLPVMRDGVEKAEFPEPWWVERLRTEPEMDFYQNETLAKLKSGDSSQGTWNSRATTVGPKESSTGDSFWDKSPEERSELLKQQNLDLNRGAAAFYRDNSRVSSYDMCRELNLCSIDSDQAECLKFEWKNRTGEDQERRANIQLGKVYHCRIFSYNALKDEWIGNDTFCKFTRLLDVEQEGGSRVPILGEGGGNFDWKDLQSVFKMYRDAGDHRLDKYLADVRAQSVAAHHADRFRELTDDKFGCMTMLTVELLLVYDTFERNTIIDFATREVKFGRRDFVKFTNNWSWKNRSLSSDIFEAFSHFTHADSDGVIMVTDLQGFVGVKTGIHYVLTDPVIHSQARDTQTFGRTNYGTEGMEEFFASVHKECNQICEFLKLERPSNEKTPA